VTADRTQEEQPLRQERLGTNASPGRVLILGDAGDLAGALAQRLEHLGAEVVTVLGGRDSELTVQLAQPGWSAVAVLTHDDALALRLTLLSAHVSPQLPLWVTLFDRTIVHQIRQVVPSVNVFLASELVAHELAGLCAQYVRGRRSALGSGLRIVDDALKLMVLTGAGLLAAGIAQTVITVAALHDNLINALYFSTRSIATVADVPRSGNAPDWYKLISTVTTTLAVVLVAIFTAALVRRLSRPRLTTLFGARRAVAHDHALLVGFGQIGFRLAQELQSRGIPVIALERDVQAPCVRLARRAGIPVAIGRGDDRETLEALGVRRCAVVAAVTSDDLANVSIGLAATDVRPEVPLVLRLGDGNVATETKSLLHLGRICDAHELIARALSEALLTEG
jgi:voltage-gated potassium channel Kch